MKLILPLVILAACSAGCVPTGGGYGSASIERSMYVDMGGCQQGRIPRERQDMLCNRQNGNPYH